MTMKVKDLMRYLEDVDPDLPVAVRANDTDYDYEWLTKEKICIDYITGCDDEDDENDIDTRSLILGEFS